MPHSSHHARQTARFGRRLALTLGLLAGAAILSQSLPAQAQNADGFLKGKTVHFIVGYSPGGGYDTYARMLAPFFEKHTGATVVVENKPGGGGMTALNQTGARQGRRADHAGAQRRSPRSCGSSSARPASPTT